MQEKLSSYAREVHTLDLAARAGIVNDNNKIQSKIQFMMYLRCLDLDLHSSLGFEHTADGYLLMQ